MSLADRLDSTRRARQPVGVPPEPHAGFRLLGSGTDPLAAVEAKVHQALVGQLGPRLYDPQLPADVLEQKVRTALQSVLDLEETPLSARDRTLVAQQVRDEVLGYGPLESLLRDQAVTEIMVNGAAHVYVERGGRVTLAPVRFTDEDHLRRTIDKIVGRVGRRVDESSPMVDVRLPDGSRVNAVVPPVALDGSTLTIRKVSHDPLTDADLIAFGTMTPTVRDFLARCIEGRRNILVSGGTGSGKTTLLNVLAGYIPADQRIVTIEDAAELHLHQPHVVRLESRPQDAEGRGEIAVRDLVRNALRMRPDRLVVGEVRDGAALDVLQALNAGHDGSLTTVHAHSARDSLARLETLVLLSGIDLPVRAIRDQVASGIDLVVQQSRLRDGSRRIIGISEVRGLEGDTIVTQELYTCDHSRGRDEHGRFLGSLVPTGSRPRFSPELADHGVELPPHLFATKP